MTDAELSIDVAIIGGGQAALAVRYYLRRTGLAAVLLDDQESPGGVAATHLAVAAALPPAQWSSLPGWLMPRGSAGEWRRLSDARWAVAYLAEYERRFALPIERPVRVHAVRRDGTAFLLETSAGTRRARAVVSATGTWAAPIVPDVPGRETSPVPCSTPRRIPDRRRSPAGASSWLGVATPVRRSSPSSLVANVTWATREPPHFLPDVVDGASSSRRRPSDGARWARRGRRCRRAASATW